MYRKRDASADIGLATRLVALASRYRRSVSIGATLSAKRARSASISGTSSTLGVGSPSIAVAP